jgi:MSHA biogenesis protein MshJ
VKRAWQTYMERIDGATLRERALIFAAAALLLIALLNKLVIEPELTTQKRLSREVVERQGQIRDLQTQIQKLALMRQSDPDKVQREKVEDLRRRVADADAKLMEEQRRFAAPNQVGALLEEMLSRNRRLQLVDMRSLPAASLQGEEQKPAASGKPAAEKPAAEKPAAEKPAVEKPAAVKQAAGQIYRHGVEITVAGSYLDLLAYLQELEKLPSQLYWGRIELDTAAGGAAGGRSQVSLKLSVYTLSLDLAWLIV